MTLGGRVFVGGRLWERREQPRRGAKERGKESVKKEMGGCLTWMSLSLKFRAVCWRIKC